MNKGLKLFFMMFASVLLIGFASCDKDDDGDTTDYAKYIVGSYVGTLSGTKLPVAVEDVEIGIKYVSLNKVELVMEQDIMGDMQINISATSPVVFVEDKYYHIEGTTTFEMFELPMPVIITGEIDQEGKMNIAIAVGVEESAMVFTYEGEKQVAE